jgi:hypothetical protein
MKPRRPACWRSASERPFGRRRSRSTRWTASGSSTSREDTRRTGAAGPWTRIRIVVSGTEARLFVHGSAQPALIIHDLKLGKTLGKIALWIGQDTEGYFSDLVVR